MPAFMSFTNQVTGVRAEAYFEYWSSTRRHAIGIGIGIAVSIGFTPADKTDSDSDCSPDTDADWSRCNRINVHLLVSWSVKVQSAPKSLEPHPL
jgi:hypothetical protein